MKHNLALTILGVTIIVATLAATRPRVIHADPKPGECIYVPDGKAWEAPGVATSTGNNIVADTAYGDITLRRLPEGHLVCKKPADAFDEKPAPGKPIQP